MAYASRQQPVFRNCIKLTVFGHFRKWCKSGIWQQIWIHLLEKYKSHLDMSSVDLDGSHTPALRGGSQVAYQGRKKK